MVIATIPPSLPEPDDHIRLLKEMLRSSLQEVVKHLPVQEDAEKTIVEIIADILIRNNVTVSDGVHALWSKRLLRFATEQSLLIPAPVHVPVAAAPGIQNGSYGVLGR